MALPLHIKTLEDVDEPFREHYVESTISGVEGFVFDGTSGSGLTIEHNVENLKRSLSSARADAKKAQDTLAKFKDADGNALDPDEVAQAIERLEQLGDDADIEERIKTAVQDKLDRVQRSHADEVKRLTSERDEAQTMRSKQATRFELMKYLAPSDKEAARARDPELLLLAFEGQVKHVTNDNGRDEFHVLDENGNRRYSDRTGQAEQYMGLDELVESSRNGRFKDQFVVPEVKGTTSAPRKPQPERQPAAVDGDQRSASERLKAVYAQKYGE